MKTYVNNFGLLAFTIEGTDYISYNKGDSIDLPESNEYVQTLVGKGMISENIKSSKTQK